MISVLYVISNLNPQGPINQLFYLCKHLNKNHIQPIIVTTSQNDFKKSMHNQFQDIGVIIIDLKLSKVKSIYKARRKIQNLIDDKKIDIIQSFGFRSDLISSGLKKVFKITTVRNTLLINYEMIWGKIVGNILGRINLYFIRKNDAIIACSSSIHNYLKTLDIDSYVITNAYDLNNQNKYLGKEEIKNSRSKLNLPIDEQLFITVSSRLKGKNVEFLINSFLKKELSHLYLVIAGYVEYKTKKKYLNSRNLIFIDQVSNLHEYLDASDFFISASLHEGMPNAVLESMAVGTPVLLSDIPPHCEIVERCSSPIGMIFNNNNFECLKKNIDLALSSNYKKLSRNCISELQESFDAVTMAMKYEDIYTRSL